MFYFVVDTYIIINTGKFYQNYHQKHGERFLGKVMQHGCGGTNETYTVQVRICSTNECHQKYFDNHLKNDSFVLHGLI